MHAQRCKLPCKLGLRKRVSGNRYSDVDYLQLAAYRSSSPVVALWLGRPAATFADASDAEFFTGEYAAHTWGSSKCVLGVYFWGQAMYYLLKLDLMHCTRRWQRHAIT